jgi:hypothetical protein
MAAFRIKMAAATVRFADYSEGDLQDILIEKDAKNTKRAAKHAVQVFETFLKEKG